MFIEDGGALTMVGVNWFIANDGNNDLNGQSYLGNYDTEIQTYIDANAVPEIEHLGLWTGVIVLIWSIRRRQRFHRIGQQIACVRMDLELHPLGQPGRHRQAR